jgi:hypothetical protein
MVRCHRLIACLVALLLVLSQQAAFAHLIGHSGATAEATAKPGEDSGHAAALTLSHQCTTCLAFAALASPAPLAASPSAPVATTTTATPPEICRAPLPGSAPLAYLSRAPPA